MKILIEVCVVALVACVLLVALCVYYNQALQCVEYHVEAKQLPQSFRGSKLILLTDLHENEFGRNNVKLVQKVREQKPDYIMIAGDLMIKGQHMRTDKILHLLSQLTDICPVYYAPGNHEEYCERLCEEEYAQYIQKLKEIGVIYLANQSAWISRGDEKICVTGLHLQKKYFAKFYESVTFSNDNLKELVGEKQGAYEILLAHNPCYFPVYAQWGADLVLSGHVHGGVVILPWIGGLISTTYELFPQYDYGMFQEGASTMILSKGLGVHTIKLRLFNVPEISVICLD